MADGDAANGFGFEDPSLNFMGDGSLPIDTLQDSSALPVDDVSRSFLTTAAAWDLDVLPSNDSYDISTTTTAVSSAQPVYVSSPWQVPPFNQQLLDTSGANGFALPNNDPSPVFRTVLDASERGTDLAETKPTIHSQFALAPDLQEELRIIAMPLTHHDISPKAESSPDSVKTGVGSSPDISSSSQRTVRKRKVSAEFDEDDGADEMGKPIKKTAHNMIEKRYRTNINDKIAALRDSVPSLRIMCKSARGEDTTEDREELDGLTPAHKLNKATVLSKATEYIRHLEKRNSRLLEENGAMHARLIAFEKLWMAGAMNSSIRPIPQHPTHTPMPFLSDAQPQLLASPAETPRDDTGMPTGIINADPQDMKRIIPAQMPLAEQYPSQLQQQQQQQQQQPSRYPPMIPSRQGIQQQPQAQPDGWSTTNPYLGKLMVGSLAGLMIIEALREDEQSNNQPQGRGLFSLPIELLHHIPSDFHLRIMGYHSYLSLKFVVLLGVVLWAFVPSLFDSLQPPRKLQQEAVSDAALSLESPADVRRRAWLTSIQTVWVPQHNTFLELAALLLKLTKFSIRKFMGVSRYMEYFKVTTEQEIARVKAWTIAIDSQLAGGDMDVSTTRLLLTFFASGTLPDTPMRLLLKALHVRIILWNLRHLDFVSRIATMLAEERWMQARRLDGTLHRANRLCAKGPEDELPSHLSALVNQYSGHTLSSIVIEQAHNLAFHEETEYQVTSPIEGMNLVIGDNAITCPLDAVAAWSSTEILHEVLTATVNRDEEAMKTRAKKLETAVKIAPPGSVVQIRAMLAKAAFIDRTRGASIAAALHALTVAGGEKVAPTTTSIAAYANDPDIQLCLNCATALAHLKRPPVDRLKSNALQSAITRVLRFTICSPMTLLSFSCAMELMEQMLREPHLVETFEKPLEELAGRLRRWIGGVRGTSCGLEPDVQERVIQRCKNVLIGLLGMDSDQGYASMSEDENGDDKNEGYHLKHRPLRRRTRPLSPGDIL